MSKVRLKELTINHFKGVKAFKAVFNHITNLFGENAAGKTTVLDAFLWLFFGKNCEGASTFGAKPVDANGDFIPKVETEVSALLDVDGVEILAKKVLRQKWVKRRGSADEEYSGDENVYYWNDVPMKEGDFKVKIKAIIDETIFRLITNPLYFNSMNWKDRRTTLISLAGDVSNEDIFSSLVNAGNRVQYAALIAALNQNKSLDEFKRELGAKKKKIKDESESIPSRIDEVRRGMHEAQDFAALKNQYDDAVAELVAIQNTLNDAVQMQAAENKRQADILKDHNRKVQEHTQNIFSIKSNLQNTEFEVKQKAKEQSGQLDAEIVSLSRQLADKKLDMERYEKGIADLRNQKTEREAGVADLRTQYDNEDAKTLEFTENEFCCPTCKQELPISDAAAKKEELEANFNRDKAAKLANINKNGQSEKAGITAIDTRITNGEGVVKTMQDGISEMETKLQSLQDQALSAPVSMDEAINALYDAHPTYRNMQKELAAAENVEFTEPVFESVKADEELTRRKSEINATIVTLHRELIKEEEIKKAETRILELTEQENKYAQELVELEGSEFAIMEFTKAKIETIERKINGMFSLVKFKMFTTQVNGGEAECCDIMIPGENRLVPFSDANNAARINAGIDIINTLSRFHNTSAPIFIDNRESVTNLIDSESQIVNLIVSPADKKLRVA
jgi:chromosome segregation ATPase